MRKVLFLVVLRIISLRINAAISEHSLLENDICESFCSSRVVQKIFRYLLILLFNFTRPSGRSPQFIFLFSDVQAKVGRKSSIW